jgi:hypothetical protein
MSQNTKLPILPKATAVWLVENTALTFSQIADFCGMHELEVKGIADGEVANGVAGVDPVSVTNQLTKAEIDRCSKDHNTRLKAYTSTAYELIAKKKKHTKYTPIARRQDKPDAIYWLLKNCPDVQDNQIVKLVGTTKSTIGAIRDRSHWNIKNIRPRDPVLLGICRQIELDRLMIRVKDTESHSEDKAH